MQVVLWIIGVIAETLEMYKECVKHILYNDFKIRKVFTKMMPKILTVEQ